MLANGRIQAFVYRTEDVQPVCPFYTLPMYTILAYVHVHRVNDYFFFY